MTNFAAYMHLLDTMKARVGLIIVIIGLTLSGCQREDRPESVLPPEEISKLMVELYLAEARMSAQAMSRDSAIKYFLPFEEKFLKETGVPDSILRITYQYYTDHPQEFEKIYDSVIDTLSLREQKERTRESKVN